MLNIPHIYFLGRSSQCGGYRAVAINYLAAIESANLDYTFISTDILRTERNHEVFSFKTKRPSLIWIYDTPDMLPYLHNDRNNCRIIAGTLFETATLPELWLDPLLTASEKIGRASCRERV